MGQEAHSCLGTSLSCGLIEYLYLLAELQIENEKIELTKKQDYECKCNNILSSKFG